ncbi:MAG: alanine dehydrogenase, partial [Dietzia cercidiphylli]
MTGTAHPPATTSAATGDGVSPGGELLSLGLLASSTMENERRLPIHPRHLDRIEPDLRARMIVERGYA